MHYGQARSTEADNDDKILRVSGQSNFRHGDRDNKRQRFFVSRIPLKRSELTPEAIAQFDELKDHQERLRVALESARMGSWVYDVRENLGYWTAEQERVFGVPPGTFDGRFESVINLIHPDDRARMTNAFKSA